MTNGDDVQEAERSPALPCIVCDKPLTNAMHTVKNQPLQGVQFMTYGHYGTGLFDPMSNTETLVLNVCDECLEKKADKVIYRHELVGPAKYDYLTFAQYLERYP